MSNTIPFPNIVVLISHDTGRHISPYGIKTVHTPNFERLARESVQFNQAFSTCPQCSPARAALFSGRYPHSVGVMGNSGADKGWRFPDYERHASHIFRDAGYQTWLLGLLHETYMPERLGFDTIDLGYSVTDAAEHLKTCLEKRDPAKPFYCQVGCKETHHPWDGYNEPPYEEEGVTVPGYLHDGPETRKDLAKLQGSVNRLDRGLGNILDLLEAEDLKGNTIVVVTTDHGLALPHAKGTLHDSGVEVLLFMRYPDGNWQHGTSTEALVSHIDILPTLLEACSLETPANLQGKSLLPLLKGETDAGRQTVFSEKTHFHFYDPMRSIRTDRYRYIRNFEFSRQTEILFDCVSTNSGALKELGHRYAGGHADEELYDTQNDPDELENLAARPEYQEVREKLMRQLADWMHQTNDPLLQGPIPSPLYTRTMNEMFGHRYSLPGQ